MWVQWDTDLLLWSHDIRNNVIAMSLADFLLGLSTLRPLATLGVSDTGSLSWSEPKSNQNVAGYSHNTCSTIIPIYLAGSWLL